MQTLPEKVEAFAREAIAGTPLYLVEVEVRGQKNARVVRVFVDADEGVNLDTCAQVSRQLGFLLETDDTIDGKYRLEVSTPGVDRPLADPRQYKKNVGRPLSVRYEAEGGKKHHTGTLEEAGDETFVLSVKGRPEPLTIPYAAVTKATVELPW